MKYFSILFCLFLFAPIYILGQTQGHLIGDRIVVFYPEEFIAFQTLPSFALIDEPDSIGQVPSDWSIFPEFYQQNGKNCAGIQIEDETDLYGTGEVIGDLRRNDTEVILWNTDNYGYWTDDGKRLYQSHPWILGVRADGTSFGILADHTWKQSFFLDNPINIVSDGPPFRLIVIEKEDPNAVLMALSELTGKIEMPPLWAVGYHQCRYSYYPASQVVNIAETFREKNIPCDVIWMDIDYMNGYRVFTFDPIGFPDPQGLNDDLHEMGFSTIWMIDPGVKYETGYFVYDQGTANDLWVKQANGNTYYGDVWPGSCAFPDFTMPETREWWAGLYPDFMATGIDGVWNDMNEPAVFNGPDKTMPVDNVHRGGNELPEDVHLRYHNVYGMLMVKATREGVLMSNPDKRPFVLTRANFLGGQRYAATWTGDNISSWEHLKMSIPMSLNLGLSAQPFNGPDIGGFSGSPGGELLGQWMAIGAFYPFSRNHTSSGTEQQEPWAYGQQIENVSRLALERRYRLLPFLYTLFYESSQTGLPVMRPLFLADPTNPELRDEQEAFLWGDDLLIIPSWSQSPALPSGWWRDIHLFDQQLENDGFQPQLKQAEGSVIPVTEVAQSTKYATFDSITLLIAPNPDNEASGYLYADAGEGFDYQDGAYTLTEFSVLPSGNDSLLVSCSTIEGSIIPENRAYKTGLVTTYGMFYSDWHNDSVFRIPRKKDLLLSISSPANDDEFNEGEDISLQVDVEGDLIINKVTYFVNNDELIGESLSEPWDYNWQNVPLGYYTVHAVAFCENEIEITSEEISFYVGEFGSGEITYQLWWDIGGSVLVSELTSHPDYPNNPDETNLIPNFEVPTDIGEEFGARVIGYLYPPQSSTYSFWISGDDYCELWLSSDSTESNIELIAEVPGWSSPGEWEKYPEQQSDEINLIAGHKYFIIALQKEAYDHDNLAVAWEFNGNQREIIPGKFLSPYDVSSGTPNFASNHMLLKAYPNPATNQVTIVTSANKGNIEITNLTGEILFKEMIRTKSIQVDVSGFSNGVYIIIYKSNNTVTSCKLVIMD